MTRVQTYISKVKGHKTPLRFLSSTMFLYSITLFTSFITYRYVAPEYMGIWATFSTFTTIATFLRLGIPNGMNRELPYYLGKGEKEKAEGYASTTLFYSIVNSSIFVFLGVLYFILTDFSKYGMLDSSYKYAAVLFFFNIITEPYKTYLSGTFRTNENFDKLSSIQNRLALLRLLTILLIVFWGFYGYLLRELSVTLVNILLLHLNRPMPQIKPKFQYKLFKNLFEIGFSIFLTSYIATFVESVPRLYLIKETTSLELGLFSPILLMLGIVSMIPNTIGSYLYPKFAYAYGQGCNTIYFWNRMKPLLALSIVTGLLCAIVIYYIIDYILLLIPKYLESSLYIKYACLSMAFLGYKVTSVVCVILKLYKWMLIHPIVYCIIQVLSLWILHVILSNPMMVAVFSLVITNILMFIFSLAMLYYITHNKQNII